MPGDSKEVFANGEAIQLLHQPAAHTNGDSIVFFRRSDVIVTGDIFDLTSYPVIDAKAAARFTRRARGAEPDHRPRRPRGTGRKAGTMVIPGQGRDRRRSRRRRVPRHGRRSFAIALQDMIAKGMTLEQVKAARPTLEYDGRYGATTGAWTTEMFVEAAYRDLAKRKRHE